MHSSARAVRVRLWEEGSGSVCLVCSEAGYGALVGRGQLEGLGSPGVLGLSHGGHWLLGKV